MSEPIDETLHCTVCSTRIEGPDPFASFMIVWPVGPELQEVCSVECVRFLLDQWSDYLDIVEGK